MTAQAVLTDSLGSGNPGTEGSIADPSTWSAYAPSAYARSRNTDSDERMRTAAEELFLPAAGLAKKCV
jgi:hypothetical protein